MSEKQLYVGDIWKPRFTITDPITGLPATPTTVNIDFQDGKGKVETRAGIKVGEGVYSASEPLTSEGTWHATIRTTGEYQGVETISRRVLAAPILP